MKYCTGCAVTKNNMQNALTKKISNYGAGFLIGYGDKIKKCPFCNGELRDISMSVEDFLCIREASNCNRELLEAMIKLRQDDIIEYETKMSQFRTQVQQQENSRAQAANTVKCPRCGSTNITAGQRGFSLLTGFVGSGKTVNRCASCGHKWKP